MQQSSRAALVLNLMAGLALLLGILGLIDPILGAAGRSEARLSELKSSEGSVLAALSVVLTVSGIAIFFRKNWGRVALLLVLCLLVCIFAMLFFAAGLAGNWWLAIFAVYAGVMTYLPICFLKSPPVNAIFGKPE